MAEPAASTTYAMALGGGAVVASIVTGLDPDAMVGAFAGAAVFVISATQMHWAMRAMYLLVSTTMGYEIGPELNRYFPGFDSVALASFVVSVLIVTVGLRGIEWVKKLDLSRFFGGRK